MNFTKFKVVVRKINMKKLISLIRIINVLPNSTLSNNLTNQYT